ncbi:MAG TPA: hypothetical protein VKT77_11060, partial [Chthonomonadaceae bacterium]|nr:hypothetical protein [Chthonomonadaceae bacterium]
GNLFGSLDLGLGAAKALDSNASTSERVGGGVQAVGGGLSTSGAIAEMMGQFGGSAAAAEFAEFANPVGAVIGAGQSGWEIGKYLEKNTEVGQDSQDTMGGIDGMLGRHGFRTSLQLDDARQDNWSKGNYFSAAGDMLGEAGVATAGAVGGLLEGGYHGLQKLGGWMFGGGGSDQPDSAPADLQRGASPSDAPGLPDAGSNPGGLADAPMSSPLGGFTSIMSTMGEPDTAAINSSLESQDEQLQMQTSMQNTSDTMSTLSEILQSTDETQRQTIENTR